MTEITHPGVARWHQIFELDGPEAKLQGLEQLLHDEVVFHSPVVHRPIEGKLAAAMYLQAASRVLVNEHWRYVREIVMGDQACLEFITEIDGIVINGVDLITFQDGQILDFKVMVRPFKAIEKLWAMMQQALQTGAASV